MKSIKIFFEDLKKFTFLILINIFILCVLGVIEAVSLFTLVALIDFFLKKDPEQYSFLTLKIVTILDYTGIPVNIVSFIIIIITFNFCILLLQIFAKYLGQSIRLSLLSYLYNSVLREFFLARWEFFSGTRHGTLINSFTKESENIANSLNATVSFFAELLLVILYGILPFYLSWKVSLISISTALILSCPFFLLSKFIYRLGKINLSVANEMISTYHEGLTLARIVLGFGCHQKILDRFKEAFNAYCRVTAIFQTIISSIPHMYYFLGLSVVIISLFAAQKLSVSISVTAAIIYSFQKVMVSIGRLAAYKNIMDSFLPSYEQLIDLKNHASSLKMASGSEIFKDISKGITIKNLCFSYIEGEPVLRDINIYIPRGKMIAIVGESGSGKSTIIDSILGFYQPDKGLILLDDISLYDFDINIYRQKIGYVPQDSMLFNMSIRENLLWVNDSATEEDIRQACEKANADKFIEEFPEKYDTVVGDRGVRLSGGQVQRIALARAIIRKPVILLMDEATSSLDTYSERLIQEAIENISRETTVVVIAHRLSTILNADYIYLLKKGVIIEEGTYAELIDKKEEFYRMVQLQSL